MIIAHNSGGSIRLAVASDCAPLTALEQRCFDQDRLSRRSFRRLIASDTADICVWDDDGAILGYVCLLYRRGTALSRIYSIAINPDARGQGLARSLMKHAEAAAADRQCTHLRLEVRPDNAGAIQLYRQLGYRQFAAVDDYYADHSPALRMEKRVRFLAVKPAVNVPFYAQSTQFSCGAASLLMAMGALTPSRPMARNEELQLWREATTIFMTSGHGGCGPHGLALAAWRRGYNVELFLNQQGPLFLDGVRDQDKKAVMTLVQEDFMNALADSTVTLHDTALTAAELAAHARAGRIPVVLISTYRMNRNKAPHWVVVTAADDTCLYVHDPDVDDDDESSATDNVHVPIPLAQFDAMARFGSQGLRTALVLSLPEVPAIKPVTAT